MLLCTNTAPVAKQPHYCGIHAWPAAAIDASRGRSTPGTLQCGCSKVGRRASLASTAVRYARDEHLPQLRPSPPAVLRCNATGADSEGAAVSTFDAAAFLQQHHCYSKGSRAARRNGASGHLPQLRRKHRRHYNGASPDSVDAALELRRSCNEASPESAVPPWSSAGVAMELHRTPSILRWSSAERCQDALEL